MTDFSKPPLTPEQQLALLEARGLTVNDPERAQRLLEVNTLFRLSPYMRPFQDSNRCRLDNVRSAPAVGRG
ncbi:hypothetical protein [Vreelandella jeotgali]|uniref:hypothetical protein n=1 Tax=Vreelandella jeotgali TaxID=553386 RepID=UPI00037024E1|nr:hypothetical protein [Halomonas jeotgali]